MRSTDYAKGFKYPVSKTEKLVVQDLADEILIYDLEKNKAYNLNQTSALVWQACDGKKDIDHIAAEIEKKLNQKVTADLVLLALDGLKQQGLVIMPDRGPELFAGFNRRETIKRVGLLSMAALPMIGMLAAPTSAQAGCSNGCAPVCFDCSKKTDATCNSTCSGLLGCCYNNTGCGAGGLLSTTAISCIACNSNFMTPGGQSWVAVPIGQTTCP